MGGYNIVAGFLIFFFLFVYFVWFGTSLKIENDKDKKDDIKINPYDQIPVHRKLIDKKNKKVGRKIAERGKKKYLKYFNSELVSDFIITKTYGSKSKNSFIWNKN